MLEPQGLLLLSHLQVQNANAISSPLVWGFPSPMAFLGFSHALQRAIQGDTALELRGVGIVCHRFEPQASQPRGKRNFVFHLTRNPVGSDGGTAAIVEEGRTHLDVSLVIGVFGDALGAGRKEEFERRVAEAVASMRIAGGSLLPDPNTRMLAKAEMLVWPGTHEDELKLQRQLRRKLLPGFALVSREALLEQRLAQLKEAKPETTLLDAWLDMSSLNMDSPTAGGEQGWRWRKKPGWIVPITTGFHALSELLPAGSVRNARDKTTPFRFVEGVYTLGQWLSPHRVDDVRQLLWTYEVEPQSGLYRGTTPYFSQLESELEG